MPTMNARESSLRFTFKRTDFISGLKSKISVNNGGICQKSMPSHKFLISCFAESQTLCEKKYFRKGICKCSMVYSADVYQGV